MCILLYFISEKKKQLVQNIKNSNKVGLGYFLNENTI